MVLSTGPVALPAGVDSLALGDVNGAQLADIAVAGREGGDYVVNIYDSRGLPSSSSSTGWTPNPVATLVNPLGAGVGPLSIALGDFDGSGTSQLAVAASKSIKGQKPVVAIYQFSVAAGTPPMGAAVTPEFMTSFLPAGMRSAAGLQLAAADLNGNGQEELIVGAAGGEVKTLDVMSDGTSTNWTAENQFSLGNKMKTGVFVSAGALTKSGGDAIVVGSATQNDVEVLNPSTGKVERKFKPFTEKNIGARVAVVSTVNQAGSIVVTPVTNGSDTRESVIISASTWKGKGFNPVDSPGEGELVPLGAGYVYQRSTITNLTTSLPTSDGPVTPSVIFGSQDGTTLVVQGFKTTKKSFAPNSADAIVEPTLEQATPSAVFYPLEIPGDLPGLKGATAYPAIAYPESTYQSPFSINLSGAPSSIYAGLLPTTPVINRSAKGWGPSNPATSPPTVTTGEGAEWLEARLLAVYKQAIGVAYQHHHDPFWLPTQGSKWNAVNIGYQSQGVDCTNLTAYAYWDAFGVFLNGDTPSQASISPTNNSSNLITIPQSMAPYLSIQVHPGPAGASLSDYESFVSQLRPGDILYINPSKTPGEASDPSACTHAITWLGHFGVDANGMYPNLIVDSTGNQPAHVDSSNHEIPGGVHVRPFAAPNAQGLNMWYFEHVDHVLRLVVSA